MTAIICTLIICITVLLCTEKLVRSFKPDNSAQQTSSITNEELEKAYEEAERDNTPDFQDVINAVNKEFIRIMEEDDV